METKIISKVLFALVSILAVMVSVSAAEIADISSVYIDDVNAFTHNEVSVTAGSNVVIDVYFTALTNATDVRIKAELEGEKTDAVVRTPSFDVEANISYRKSLVLKVPYELWDEVSDHATLNLKIWNGDFKTEREFVVRVQRPSYNAEIKSVSVESPVKSGEYMKVNVVVKNRGYNDINDLYLTVRIPALGLDRSAYLGDLVPIDPSCDEDCDETDTVSRTISLRIPDDTKPGIYNMEVVVSGDDLQQGIVKSITIQNEFPGNTIVPTDRKKAGTDENVDFELLLINPTSNIKVYRIVPESSKNLEVSASDSLVVVPAGSSRSITITANAAKEGDYTFNVKVFAGNDLINEVAYSLSAEEDNSVDPLTIITVILAVVFVVLVAVLIVLLTRRQPKEDLGESYY